MLSARYFSAAGEPGDAVQLPQELFDGIVNDAVLHQVVKAYLANQRQGNGVDQDPREVSGGEQEAVAAEGDRPRAPGLHPRPALARRRRSCSVRIRATYHQDMPKKVKALARRSAFNTRAQDEQVTVMERFDLDAPKTRRVVELLGKIGVADKKVLVLTDGINKHAVPLGAQPPERARAAVPRGLGVRRDVRQPAGDRAAALQSVGAGAENEETANA